MRGEGMNEGSEGSMFNLQCQELYIQNCIYSKCYLHGCRAQSKIKKIYFNFMEECDIKICNYSSTTPNLEYILVGCRGDASKSIIIKKGNNSSETFSLLTDIEIGDKEYIDKGMEPRWKPQQNLNISAFRYLTRDNVINHIFDRLNYNSNSSKLTITISSSTYNLLSDEDKGIVTDKNYTIAYA